MLTGGGTFHSLGHSVLRKFAERAGVQRHRTVLDQGDTDNLIDLLRRQIRLAKDRRLPRKRTIAAIFSTIVNKVSPVNSSLSSPAGWSLTADALRRVCLRRDPRQLRAIVDALGKQLIKKELSAAGDIDDAIQEVERAPRGQTTLLVIDDMKSVLAAVHKGLLPVSSVLLYHVRHRWHARNLRACFNRNLRRADGRRPILARNPETNS